MMTIVSLEEIKANSRIEGNAEDTLLESLGEAAEVTVLNLIERTQ